MREVTVGGTAGVPPGADAVVLNVTVTGTTGNGFLTIWPGSLAVPTASSLNRAPGDTIANSVTAKLSPSGGISVKNAVGDVHVIADIAGWFG